MQTLLNMNSEQAILHAGMSVRRTFPDGDDGWLVRMRSWGIALLIHAAVAGVLLSNWSRLTEIDVPLSPITVRMLEAERPAPPEAPPPPPPKVVRPVPQKPAPIEPVVAPATPAPLAPVAPPEPVMVSESVPVVPPAPIEVPEPLVEARFDADYLSNPKPPYPMASRRLGEEGVVRLRVQVGQDGRALKVELKHGSGFSRLDQSALDTVAQWRFVPARRGSKPVTSWVVVPIVFSLS